MAGRTGRKPLYNPENLEIGGRIELKGAKKKFRHQYIYNWEKRINEKRIDFWRFRAVTEGSRVFIERCA